VIGATPRERNSRRNNPTVHSVLAVYSSKEPRPSEILPTDGVSTYLALTFGTLLSSQGTDASFVLTLSGFPPGASLRCFRLYQIFSRSDSLPERVVLGLVLFGSRPFDIHYVSRFPSLLIIEFADSNSSMQACRIRPQ
jgi:hypothetical protein